METNGLQNSPEMPWSSSPAMGLLVCCSTSGAEAESGGFVQPGKGKAAKGALAAAGSCLMRVWREAGARLSWEVPRDRMRDNSTKGKFLLDIRKSISSQGQLDSVAGPREGGAVSTFGNLQGQALSNLLKVGPTEQDWTETP